MEVKVQGMYDLVGVLTVCWKDLSGVEYREEIQHHPNNGDDYWQSAGKDGKGFNINVFNVDGALCYNVHQLVKRGEKGWSMNDAIELSEPSGTFVVSPQPKPFEPTELTDYQSEVINALTESMCKAQDAITEMGLLPEKQIGWCNDLYDAVMVSLGNDPDGDNQERIIREEEAMTYLEMAESLSVRIHAITAYVVEHLDNIKK